MSRARAGEILVSPPSTGAIHDLEYANGLLSHVEREKDCLVVQIDTPEESKLIALPLDTDLDGYVNQQICLMKCDGKVLIRLAGMAGQSFFKLQE